MKALLTTIIAVSFSSLAFADQGGNDPIPGIDVIVKRDPASKPIANPQKDPLIEKINKLEMHYLNLRAKQIQNGFASSKEAKAAKSKDAVLKAYIVYLQREVKSVNDSRRDFERLQSLQRSAK